MKHGVLDRFLTAEWVFKIDTRKNAAKTDMRGEKNRKFLPAVAFRSAWRPRQALRPGGDGKICPSSTVDDVNHLRASGDPRGDGDDDDRGNHPETDDDGGKDHAERGIRRERPDRAERIEPPE